MLQRRFTRPQHAPRHHPSYAPIMGARAGRVWRRVLPFVVGGGFIGAWLVMVWALGSPR